MGGLNGGNDALGAGEVFEGVYRLVIGDRHIFRPAGVVEPGVLRARCRDSPDRRRWSRPARSGRTRPGRSSFSSRGRCPSRPVATVAAVSKVSMPRPAASQPMSRTRRVVDEVVEGADGVAAAAHAGDHRVGKLPSPAPASAALISLRDDRLKVPDDGGEGVGPHDRSPAQ